MAKKRPKIQPPNKLATLDENGSEVLDPTPVAVPLRFQQKISTLDDIRALVRKELSIVAASKGFETFEEADDFDVGDFDPTSPYELNFEQSNNEYIPPEGDKSNPGGGAESPAGPAQPEGLPLTPQGAEPPASKP